MDSNIIKFRLSSEFLQLLESAKLSEESLHQTAKYILEEALKSRIQNTVHSTQLGYKTQYTERTQDIAEVVQQKIEELESDLYRRLSDQLNRLLDARLGEFAA
jgi:phosphoenolpyruvate-protein kinase (PTS system EI component)